MKFPEKSAVYLSGNERTALPVQAGHTLKIAVAELLSASSTHLF
jgi:hypothetical protein